MDSTPPRKRKFGPKVKTGCQTCKIRRVKCDEAKPACFRCTSTGRKCDGYLKDVLHSHSATSQSLVLLQRPSTSISGSAEERRGFHYYMNNTARELSGYYDSSFWEKLLVQAAVAEPSLRHAVIGIGSLHKAFATQRLNHSPDHTDHGFAMNQYTKAIGYLRRSLATGAQQPLVALMSCILFVCFDSIRGHYASALVHLHSGFKILRDLKKISAADEYIIAMSLAPAFTRLSIQAVLYIDTTADRKAFALEMTEFSERECQIPDTFSTVEEARDAFSQTTNCLFRTFYMFDPDLPFRAHVDILPLHAKYSKQLANWNIAYEKFMQKNNSRLSSKEIRGAAMLKVQYAAAFIMSNSGIPNADDPRSIAEILNDRKVFMRYHNDFENIVKLSRSLISASEADSHSGKPAFNFSADLGIVGPLYYCCIKCPDYTLRLAAIELLHRCPRREGMWDSAALVQLIRGFWEIEARYEALKDEIVDNNGKPVALTDLPKLVLKDGMKWEWRWKEVAWAPGLADPHYTWAEILEDPTLASVNEKDTNGP